MDTLSFNIGIGLLLITALPVFYFDLRYLRIPNWLTLLCFLLFLQFVLLFKGQTLIIALISAAAAFLILAVPVLAFHLKLGWGDIKYAAALAVILPFPYINLVFLAACLSALFTFLIINLKQGFDQKKPLAFGPFLAGSAIMVFAFQTYIDHWLRQFLF